MIRTFFVLDFDGTYDLEPEDEYGVEPVVYMIPKESETAVFRYARLASRMFLETVHKKVIWCVNEKRVDRTGSKLPEKQISEATGRNNC